jgi:cobaltochelatase CobN
VFGEQVSAFLRRANPWAQRDIAGRLLEAADRGLWAPPEVDVIDRLQAAYLELEGGDGA